MSPPPGLGALYLQHRDAMYRVAAGVLREAGRESEAEDAVSDAIVSLLASPPTGVANWEAFLVTAAKRKALDRLRSAEVRHAGPDLDTSVHDRSDGFDLADEVATDIDRQRRAAVAWDALAVLETRHRKVVWEIAGLGRKRAEVAADLGVTPARVSQMMTRALEDLRGEMRRKEGSGE